MKLFKGKKLKFLKKLLKTVALLSFPGYAWYRAFVSDYDLLIYYGLATGITILFLIMIINMGIWKK